ncbi:16S rRNA (cytosine(1402)-N(4))-methyltransferase RsmH [Candidatus Kaiserbacteria bacterium]|nr:16S rRNA (cytosine(1402)-N(4))-methyltransferase RsmH [Candidatus Kaiserbacteria bacterium]
MTDARHEPVLLTETIEALAIKQGDTVLDATLGGAGHFEALLSKLGEGGVIIGIDADPAAVERARKTYALDRRPERPVAHLVNDNFRNLGRILERLGAGQIDAALFDLGWSGFQLAEPRGFSFQRDEPLLMTYDGEGSGTAADIVNSASENELADLIYAYGEERFARGIARAIVARRSKDRILTTGALVEAVLAGTPGWYHEGKTHPATRTFQALRIAANDELNALREGLDAALQALAPGGRLAVITFHSIEDRIVKNLLRDSAQSGCGTVRTKKPIVPTRPEILRNRRARSAKLRLFERQSADRRTGTSLDESVSDGLASSLGAATPAYV